MDSLVLASCSSLLQRWTLEGDPLGWECGSWVVPKTTCWAENPRRPLFPWEGSVVQERCFHLTLEGCPSGLRAALDPRHVWCLHQLPRACCGLTGPSSVQFCPPPASATLAVQCGTCLLGAPRPTHHPGHPATSHD